MSIAKASLRYFTASRRLLCAIPTDNLQALSIVPRNVQPQDTQHLGGANAPSKKNLEAPMKSRISLLLMSLALAASSTLIAHASSCSDSTIIGTYAFTLHGTIFLPGGSTLLIDGIAKQTYDGQGNMTQVDAVATNGVLTPGWRSGTGTYSVNSDCTGTLTIVVPGLSDLHLQFIVAQSGNTIHQVVTDPGIATTGEGERLRIPKK
jgi:hypothetical protein